MQTLELDKEALDLEKKRASTEQKKAEAKDKRAEAELIKQEKDIMFTDMTSINPLQRQWIETMQKEIVARRLAK